MDCSTNVKLSVLVTFCNQIDYIQEALDGILNQKTDFDFEVLVGLNGPDDGSYDVLKEYESRISNIKLFNSNEDESDSTLIEKISRNRLNLIKHACGEYFCVLDGDDFYTDEKRFQILVDFLDKNRDCIGCANNFIEYDDDSKKFAITTALKIKEQKFDASQYIKSKLHISSNAFIFRNIFAGQCPSDFPKNFFNDSSLTHYMLKYGKLYYLPLSMMAYRHNKNSTFNSQNYYKKLLISLICAEVNQKILSSHEKLMVKKYKKLVLKCFLNRDKLSESVNTAENYKQLAQSENCYFANAILNYDNLTQSQKSEFLIKIIKYMFFNEAPVNQPSVGLFYFDGIPNFGDELNLYIINRLFNLNAVKEKASKAKLVAIGSLLDTFLVKKYNPSRFFKIKEPINVWGTGFIAEKGLNKNRLFKLNRNLEISAVRGLHSKEYLEELTGKSLDGIAMGDPGLLAPELVDTANIEKKYKVGLILHYVDQSSDLVKNINIDDYKVINISNNPITVIREIAQCEFIISSAMHGLISADALGIPNVWVQLSDMIYGNNFKFKDYYSVFGIQNPSPIDLRKTTIQPGDLDRLKDEYAQKIPPETVAKIKNNLLHSFPLSD